MPIPAAILTSSASERHARCQALVSRYIWVAVVILGAIVTFRLCVHHSEHGLRAETAQMSPRCPNVIGSIRLAKMLTPRGPDNVLIPNCAAQWAGKARSLGISTGTAAHGCRPSEHEMRPRNAGAVFRCLLASQTPRANSPACSILRLGQGAATVQWPHPFESIQRLSRRSIVVLGRC